VEFSQISVTFNSQQYVQTLRNHNNEFEGLGQTEDELGPPPA